MKITFYKSSTAYSRSENLQFWLTSYNWAVPLEYVGRVGQVSSFRPDNCSLVEWVLFVRNANWLIFYVQEWAGVNTGSGIWPTQSCCDCKANVQTIKQYFAAEPFLIAGFFSFVFMKDKDNCMVKIHDIFFSPTQINFNTNIVHPWTRGPVIWFWKRRVLTINLGENVVCNRVVLSLNNIWRYFTFKMMFLICSPWLNTVARDSSESAVIRPLTLSADVGLAASTE